MKLRIYSYKRDRLIEFFEQLKSSRIYCLETNNLDRMIKLVQDRNFNIIDYAIIIPVNLKQLDEIIKFSKSYFCRAIEYYPYYKLMRI